jgi:hypothetical protein
MAVHTGSKENTKIIGVAILDRTVGSLQVTEFPDDERLSNFEVKLQILL